jgi:hypothetical protein
MRSEIDMGRRFEEENRMLRSEVQSMWQHLQRIDPNTPHVFGSFTNQLQHEQPQASPAPASMLPPLQQPGQWVQAPAAAMQGVEYAPGQGYDHR